ncbi:PREDICTED: uncharacterized protein LOC108558781 [Nicrophorus vespilloides]|uniref:Uncharacterized protein LOC108558781 n=1 Tax=Nicrophorus vespilloides TaxID=110193 RepID=A0ABM1M9Q2_NICVS|nr:PREDICTED: uncharacterized protein LOC108558781 [Nicrophorus vespilloides]
MNVLLKCFFEHFESMERNSLHARYKRRDLVEYFNTLIEGCRLGENSDSQTVVREAIVCILRYHQKSKTENGGVCLMGKYHNVLYVGLKLCFDWGLRDTATVAALLDDIYHCEGTFERLMIGALFGTRAPHFIAGWKSDFDSQEENVRAMVYYLDHATNANLEYACGHENKRFIDVPIDSCGKATCLKIVVQLGVPDKLLILLRYGARIYDEDNDDEETVVDIILNRLTECDRSYPYNIVSCLQLVLRAMPRICIQADCSRSTRGSFQTQMDIVLARYPYLVQDCILPASRCGFQPPELKHLCRCVIRYQLWINYQLPNGIRLLPIPGSLHKYIDIMED